jgi:hypothetical protein
MSVLRNHLIEYVYDLVRNRFNDCTDTICRLDVLGGSEGDFSLTGMVRLKTTRGGNEGCMHQPYENESSTVTFTVGA